MIEKSSFIFANQRDSIMAVAVIACVNLSIPLAPILVAPTREINNPNPPVRPWRKGSAGCRGLDCPGLFSEGKPTIARLGAWGPARQTPSMTRINIALGSGPTDDQRHPFAVDHSIAQVTLAAQYKSNAGGGPYRNCPRFAARRFVAGKPAKRSGLPPPSRSRPRRRWLGPGDGLGVHDSLRGRKISLACDLRCRK